MAVPAWKQAILEKKRKQEEEKKKRQDDKEAYIASLPPWKQAKARKKLETDENVTIPPVTKHATVPSVTKYAPVPSQVVAGKPRTTNGTMNCVQEPLSSKTVSDVARVFSVQDKLLVEASSLPEPHRHIESEMLEVKPCSDDGKATNAFRLNRPKMKKSASQEVDETDPQFQAMPKWKQELLRRRKSKEEQTKLPGSKQQTEVKQSETRTEKAKQDHKHGVVSSSENNDSPKLIQKEGKTLKPPVFNMASKWANITEDDPDFKKLPSWKQAVIRRRKEDATKRTAPESPVTERKVLENSISIITPWSPSNEVPLSNAAENTLSNEVPHWKKKLKHTAISFPSLQLPKHENEPLFASQLHNKKAQKLLRRFSQPSGSTSNPVDDTAGVTMIDEESDDDFPISSLGRKESALRRVSFSDSDLTTQHFYPKYDYSDYHEIVQEEKTDGNEIDGIATPIHPWLTTIKTPPPKPDPTPVTLSTEGLDSFNSLGSFMSAYTSNSYNSNKSKLKDNEFTNIEESKQSNNDTYSSTDDTAALMF